MEFWDKNSQKIKKKEFIIYWIFTIQLNMEWY